MTLYSSTQLRSLCAAIFVNNQLLIDAKRTMISVGIGGLYYYHLALSYGFPYHKTDFYIQKHFG